MKKIAWIVTNKNKIYEEVSNFTAILAKHHNVAVELVSWLDEPSKNLSEFDLIVVNGVDGYHQHFVKFNSWLVSLEPVATKVFNPLPAIRWNMDKTYLQEIDRFDFSIPETIWVKQNQQIPFAELLQKNWRKAIFKPTISAGSANTFVFALKDLEKQKPDFSQVLQHSGLIIQEFMEDEISRGEFSFLFFDKKFSHAVLKVPGKNDFRAGIRQGAVVSAIDITSSEVKYLLEFSQKIVDSLPFDLLYARVDLLSAKEKILVMEIELIEPLLYSEFSKDAASNYVVAIVDQLNHLKG